MKKIASFLALVIVFCSLVGCSNSGSQNKKAEDGIWSVQKTTDEFGDVTADSQDFISASVQGLYENEEATDSQLDISVSFRKRSDSNHYIVEFQLTENNTTKIQYKENSYKQLKTKVGEETQEFYLTFDESNDSLSNGNEVFYEINYGGDYVFSNLYNGKDVKCVITEDDSVSYSFELKSDNFKALCDLNSFTQGTGDITLRESVNFLLHDKGIMIAESCDYLINNYETFDVVKTEEIKELFNGEFLMVLLNGAEFCPWLLKRYSAVENTMERLLTYNYAEWKVNENYKYGIAKYRDDFHGYDHCRDISGWQDIITTISLENNLIANESNNYKQEIRKITDNIFISTIEKDEIEAVDSQGISFVTKKYYYILIKFDKSITDTVEYAQENYIQEIPY